MADGSVYRNLTDPTTEIVAKYLRAQLTRRGTPPGLELALQNVERHVFVEPDSTEQVFLDVGIKAWFAYFLLITGQYLFEGRHADLSAMETLENLPRQSKKQVAIEVCKIDIHPSLRPFVRGLLSHDRERRELQGLDPPKGDQSLQDGPYSIGPFRHPVPYVPQAVFQCPTGRHSYCQCPPDSDLHFYQDVLGPTGLHFPSSRRRILHSSTDASPTGLHVPSLTHRIDIPNLIERFKEHFPSPPQRCVDAFADSFADDGYVERINQHYNNGALADAGSPERINQHYNSDAPADAGSIAQYSLSSTQRIHHPSTDASFAVPRSLSSTQRIHHSSTSASLTNAVANARSLDDINLDWCNSDAPANAGSATPRFPGLKNFIQYHLAAIAAEHTLRLIQRAADALTNADSTARRSLSSTQRIDHSSTDASTLLRSSIPSKRQRIEDDASGSSKRKFRSKPTPGPDPLIKDLRNTSPSISISPISRPPEPLPRKTDQGLEWLRDELGFNLAAYIPGCLRNAIEQDPELGPSLTTNPIDEEAFDYEDKRTREDPMLVGTLKKVKKILQAADRCSSDPEATKQKWTYLVVLPIIDLAIKLYGNGRWVSRAMRYKESIDPLCLSRIPDPSAPNLQRSADAKIDLCFSYNSDHEDFKSLYERFSEAHVKSSHIESSLLANELLFSGIEVIPQNGDWDEAEAQMGIWMAASLRKKMELARIAYSKTQSSESELSVDDRSIMGLLEPCVTVIGHEHRIYYAYPSSADGVVRILGPEGNFSNLSTRSVDGIFRLIAAYSMILDYGFPSWGDEGCEEGSGIGLWGRFLKPVVTGLV